MNSEDPQQTSLLTDLQEGALVVVVEHDIEKETSYRKRGQFTRSHRKSRYQKIEDPLQWLQLSQPLSVSVLALYSSDIPVRT